MEGLKLVTIPLDQLQESNYREESDVSDLIESIQAEGLLEPLLVYEEAGKKYIKNGHRRCRALIALGKKEAPCVIVPKNSDTTELRLDQVTINNTVKTDSYWLAKVMKEAAEAGKTHKEIAAKIGRSETFVTEHIGLLIPNVVFTRFVSGAEIRALRKGHEGHKKYYASQEALISAGEDAGDFEKIPGLGAEAPSLASCKELARAWNTINTKNQDQIEIFETVIAKLQAKHRTKKSDLDAAAVVIVKACGHTEPKKRFNSATIAKRLITIVGKVDLKPEQVENIQRAIDELSTQKSLNFRIKIENLK